MVRVRPTELAKILNANMVTLMQGPFKSHVQILVKYATDVSYKRQQLQNLDELIKDYASKVPASQLRFAKGGNH